jgi:hypothetical protein
MKRTKMMVAFLALSICGWVHAQEVVAEKKMMVKDGDEKYPIRDVLVKYNHGEDHTHSGGDGSFIVGIKSYPDTLTISHKGYDEVKLIVNSAEDKNNLVLLQHKPQQIAEVAINHSSFLSAITKVDLNKFPVNSAQDLLRKVPGLFIAQHAGGGKAEQLF